MEEPGSEDRKLNEQNKKLLNLVEVLSEEVKTSVITENQPNSESGEVPPKTTVEDVANRIDKIEQNLNSNVLICRGTTVESLITDSTSGSNPPNYERLKGEVCRSVCGSEATNVDICSLQVSLFGSDKKKIKIVCNNSVSKAFLLRQARKKRPNGLYVSEFLPSSKLNILYNLRQLKRQHQDKIKSVYSRNGNLYCRLKDSDREIRVNSLNDLTTIIADTEVPGAVGGGD